MSESTGLPPLPRSNSSWHKIRFDSVSCRWSCQIIRFRILRSSFTGIAKAKISRRHTILDVSRSHITTSVWTWSGYLVVGHYGDWDDWWWTAIFQWATTASDASHSRYATAKIEKFTQSFATIATISRPHARARSESKGNRKRIVIASIFTSSGSPFAARTINERCETRQLINICL